MCVSLCYNRDMKCISCGKQLSNNPRGKTGKCNSCSKIGRKLSPESRLKFSQVKMAENNPMWSGNDVGYSSLHQWVHRHLPKPSLCQSCGIVPPLDLSNKGTYDRNLDNWEWLCRRCHMTKDGRLSNLKQYQFGKKNTSRR